MATERDPKRQLDLVVPNKPKLYPKIIVKKAEEAQIKIN